jgi:hypothetical protein
MSRERVKLADIDATIVAPASFAINEIQADTAREAA